jgi:hypothetical protein
MDEAGLLHRRSAVFEMAAHFVRSFFQCTVETEGLCSRRANSAVGPVPLVWRIKDVPGTLHNTNIGLGYNDKDFESFVKHLGLRVVI